MGVQINLLRKGDRVSLRRNLNPTMVSNWKFAKECAGIGGGIMAGTVFMVADFNTRELWVSLEIPGRSPPAFLKVAGVEISGNFDKVP